MSDQGTPRLPDAGEINAKEAFIIAGAVAALLVVLVALRLFCNIFIDVIILRDGTAARRHLRDVWRRCTCWRWRRPFGEEMAVEATTATTLRTSSDRMGAWDAHFARLTFEERNAVLESILNIKTVTLQDLAAWKEQHHLHHDTELASSTKEISSSTTDTLREADHHETSSLQSQSIVCSICLHDFEVGDEVVSSDSCSNHYHHKACMLQWLHSNLSMDCPYCRTNMVSSDAIKEALRRYDDDAAS